MKTIITVLTAFLASSVFGQDDTLRLKNDNKNFEKQIIEYDENDSNKVVVRSFYDSGEIKTESNYFPYNERKRHGKSFEWFKHGQIDKEIDYENGMLHGEVLTYWENGLQKRKDLFEMNIFVEGKVWDIAGNEIEHFDFIVNPQFTGGDDKLIAYLNKNLNYPKELRRNGVEGTVIVKFTVEKDGSVSNVLVSQSVNYQLDEEAVKVVKNFPKWEPGVIDGETERIEVYFPFKFRDI